MKVTRLYQLTVLMVACSCSLLHAQSGRSIPLTPVDRLELHNVKADSVRYKDRSAVRIVEAEPPQHGGPLAIVRGTSFTDGTIELEVSGDTAPDAPAQLRGFVGVAFRVASDTSHFECFYIRPKNGRSQDQLQRNHSTQYISFPGFPWEKLRTETPGKYESYVDLVPGEWTKLKITVAGDKAQLYVNGAAQPTLLVNDLKQPPSAGAIALWIGPGTIAHFANLRVTP